MTDYNDGKWHGWNGGECPVHPQSLIEARVRNWQVSTDGRQDNAYTWRWGHNEDDHSDFDLIAFRVVKEFREPREFWIDQLRNLAVNYDPKMAGWIHVREVLEGDE